jgi:quercetin dioxygenase-like cupin family protein
MNMMNFENYQAACLAEGFDEVTERVWTSGAEAATHTHPFSVRALVVQGEMWLTVGQETRHLRSGDTFALDYEVPHAERYGESGATYWAARKHS